MVRKFFSVFLSVCMIFELMPVMVLASDVSETCGENLNWELDDEGTLSISGTGEMYDYNPGTPPWYSDSESIISIVIGDGVTYIGDSAFRSCTNLIGINS